MLQNSQKVEMYDMNLQFLGKMDVVTEDMYGHFALIFSEIPKCELPKKVFLLPCGQDGQDLEEEHFVSYLCMLSGEFSKRTDDGEYYIMEGTSEESDSLREDLRVFTSFPAVISVEGHSKSLEVEVKDISVGGIMFVSEEEVKVGKNISITFMSGRHEVSAKAVVKTRRPIHEEGRFGYGCKFPYLPQRVEAEIRSIVFNEDIVQHHRRN